MNREEKKQGNREKIISAALREFGRSGYEGASMNAAYLEEGLAKGVIYYYFRNKDEIYLCCVEACLQNMMVYVKENSDAWETAQGALQQYFQVRRVFFKENPDCNRIFFEAITQPPAHLAEKIGILRRELDEYHRQLFLFVLSRIRLRKGIGGQDAMGFFLTLQANFRSGFLKECTVAPDGTLMEELGDNPEIKKDAYMGAYEQDIAELVDMMLFGIAESFDGRKEEEGKGHV